MESWLFNNPISLGDVPTITTGPMTTEPLRPGISFSKDHQSPEFTSGVFVQASAWKALAMAGEQVDIDKVRAMDGKMESTYAGEDNAYHGIIGKKNRKKIKHPKEKLEINKNTSKRTLFRVLLCVLCASKTIDLLSKF